MSRNEKKFFCMIDLLTKQRRGGVNPPGFQATPANGREKKDPSASVKASDKQGHLLPKKSL